MKNQARVFFISVILALTSSCSPRAGDSEAAAPVNGFSEPLPDFVSVREIGGAATSKDHFATSHAFTYPIPDLTEEELALHDKGDGLFETVFSGETSHPDYGLGPVYNNQTCVGCHNRDGRGALPVGLNANNWKRLGSTEAVFLRISIESVELLALPKSSANHFGAPVAVPGFSGQLFNVGWYSLRADHPGVGQAEVHVKLEKSRFVYPDGHAVELVRPVFKIEKPYDAQIDPATGKTDSRLWQSDVRTSPRIGMPMFGLGLLEAIPESDLLALAAVDHEEGVSGKPNFVYDVEKAMAGDSYPVSLGRFGLKAGNPTVRQQSHAALNGDIGVTNALFPLESISGTQLLDGYIAKAGFKPKVEAADAVGEALTFYSKTLAVPPRRDIENPDVVTGGRLFAEIRCTSCHTPSFTTGESAIKSLSKQKIYPFTDLLLHDMGEGLADGRREFDADGREWKTRALWGIGLTHVVSPLAGFLHDGRARTVEEAILWHDGEARYARDRFAQLPADDRARVLAFLKSL